MEVKNYAVSWKRLFAGIIDVVISIILAQIFVVILLVILVSGAEIKAPFILDKVGYMGYIIDILYFALMESSSKQGTLGKMLFRIKVTDLIGNKISLWHAIERNAAKFLSAIIFSIN